MPRTLAQLACAEARLGALDRADDHLREAAALVSDAPQPLVEAVILVGLGLVAVARGDAARAALLLGAADAIHDRHGGTPAGARLSPSTRCGAAHRGLG